MTHVNHDFDRFLLKEVRRLQAEIGSQRMSWNKLGRAIKLDALLHLRCDG